jgi:hypothetical protein
MNWPGMRVGDWRIWDRYLDGWKNYTRWHKLELVDEELERKPTGPRKSGQTRSW